MMWAQFQTSGTASSPEAIEWFMSEQNTMTMYESGISARVSRLTNSGAVAVVDILGPDGSENGETAYLYPSVLMMSDGKSIMEYRDELQ